MWCVYILLCNDDTYYIGITNDIVKRCETHNKGNGAKYTKTRTPITLLKYWCVENKSIAAKWEYKLKKLTRKQKTLMLNNNTDIEVNYNEIFII